MEIAFKDFFPEKVGESRILKVAKLENSSDILRRINDWIKAENVSVINIETVVLPDGLLHAKGEELIARYAASQYITWCQFYRVWYRLGDR